MFLHQSNTTAQTRNTIRFTAFLYTDYLKKLRKEKLSPHKKTRISGVRTFFFTPLSASITIEAACVIPLFLFCMISVLQFGNVMETSVKFGTALTETSRTMAAAAYASKYGGEVGEVPELAIGVLSSAYAHQKVVSRSGNISSVKNVNMIQSSFLGDEEMIDLVLSYQIKSPIQIVKLPQSFFIQRARVRAWTGRDASGCLGDEDYEAEVEYAYVTESGSVYHTDMECSYIRLSIQLTDMESLAALRNHDGEIYRRCELCGGDSENGVIYVTNDGNKYHNSVECSGLKRTVHPVPMTKLGEMRACSKCGSGH